MKEGGLADDALLIDPVSVSVQTVVGVRDDAVADLARGTAFNVIRVLLGPFVADGVVGVRGGLSFGVGERQQVAVDVVAHHRESADPVGCGGLTTQRVVGDQRVVAVSVGLPDQDDQSLRFNL